MEKKENTKKESKLKKFFGSLAEKLDKSLEEKSKKTPCCGGNSSKGSSCCS